MRRPASQLNMEDFPTFGRPTMATTGTGTGSFSGGWGGLHVPCGFPISILPQSCQEALPPRNLLPATGFYDRTLWARVFCPRGKIYLRGSDRLARTRGSDRLARTRG